ncbi:hypothetical protein ACFL5V_04545 [Fibrobacterota bacterium]
MIKRAFSLYQIIFPCSGKNHLEECFTTTGSKLHFWFNTKDDNTHMLTADL